MTNNKCKRSAAAAVWTLVILAVISVLSITTAGHFAIARRQADGHQNRTQAEWLARSGYEIAVAKILTDAKDYSGETLTPIPGSEVKIVVKPNPNEKATYQIEIEARYPTGERGAVVRTLHRTVKRVDGTQGVRIEPVLAK